MLQCVIRQSTLAQGHMISIKYMYSIHTYTHIHIYTHTLYIHVHTQYCHLTLPLPLTLSPPSFSLFLSLSFPLFSLLPSSLPTFLPTFLSLCCSFSLPPSCPTSFQNSMTPVHLICKHNQLDILELFQNAFSERSTDVTSWAKVFNSYNTVCRIYTYLFVFSFYSLFLSFSHCCRMDGPHSCLLSERATLAWLSSCCSPALMN